MLARGKHYDNALLNLDVLVGMSKTNYKQAKNQIRDGMGDQPVATSLSEAKKFVLDTTT